MQLTEASAQARRLGWVLVAGAFIACAVLGFRGFTLYQEQAGQVDPILSRVYLTVQLFVLQSGSLSGVLPWQLEVARVLAPVVAAYTAVLSMVGLFAEQVEAWRVRRMRGHVVVAGLNDMGAAVCDHLMQSGHRVVGVHPDPLSPAVLALRSQSGLVVVGDPRSPHTLHRAGVGRATNLVVCTDDDETTVEVANAAQALTASAQHPALQCVALLSDPQLWTQQVAAELAEAGPDSSRTHFVSELSAGLLSALGAHPQMISTRGPEGVQHIVTGAGEVMANTILALVRLRGGHGDARTPLEFLVLEAHADHLQRLVSRYPEVGRWATFDLVATLDESLNPAQPHVAYVCDEDPTTAAGHVVQLSSRLGVGDHIVVVRRRHTAVTDLVACSARRAGGPAVLTLGILEEVARTDIVLTGTTELLARAMHQMYVEDRLSQGVDPAEPALSPWDAVPETLRRSKRSQATDVATKLAALGRGIGPLTDWDGSQQVLDHDEIEQLAELEHARWVAERREQGWLPGPRNPDQRTTTDLVPWTQLSEDVKELNRHFVRALPGVLAVAGLQLLPPSGQRPHVAAQEVAEQALV